MEYIYLLKEREFMKTNENIYKIGKTKQDNFKRFNSYPKGSVLIFQILCSNCTNIENKLIKLFREKYIKRKDIGNEYFEGDYINMIDDIIKIVNSDLRQNNIFKKKDISKSNKTSDKIVKSNELNESAELNELNESDKSNELNESDKSNKSYELNKPNKSNISNEPNKPNKPNKSNEPNKQNKSNILNEPNKSNILNEPNKSNISNEQNKYLLEYNIKYYCKYCNKSYHNKSNLNKHNNTKNVKLKKKYLKKHNK